MKPYYDSHHFRRGGAALYYRPPHRIRLKMNREGVGKSRRRTKTAHNSTMGQGLFTYLPSEIILNILLRLPTPTLMSCKCVCKPWLNLLKTPEFVKSHLSKSVPSLVVFSRGGYTEESELYKVFEFVDELNPMQCVRHFNMILKFNLPCGELYSSVNGLLFSCTESLACYAQRPRDLFISNPITREYIKLPCPLKSSSCKPQVQKDTFGFGLSRITGQYKLVRICQKWIIGETTVSVECQVYTVGTRTWRRILSIGLFKYKDNAKGVFLNGNLHWVVRDFKGSSLWVSCFDLETELFSTFSPPPCVDRGEDLSMYSLKDCLCLCYISALGEIVIWLMKEYEDEKSWAKELVIRNEYVGRYPNGGPIWYVGRYPNGGPICPIKVFKSGDILMVSMRYGMLLYISKKNETICTNDILKDRAFFLSNFLLRRR